MERTKKIATKKSKLKEKDIIVVDSPDKFEKEQIELILDGYDVVFEKKDSLLFRKEKSRTLWWILLFWPAIFLKVTKTKCLRLKND